MARSQSSLKRNSKVDFFLKLFNPHLVWKLCQFIPVAPTQALQAVSAPCPSGPGTRCAQLCFAGQWRGWRGDKVGLQPRKGSSRWDPASELSWYCFKPCVQKHGATVVLLHHPRFRLARSNVCLRAQQSPILNTATTRCSDFISSSSDIWRTWHQSCSQRRPCEDAFTPLSSPPVQELSAAAPRDHRTPKRVPRRESLADLKSNLQCN